MTAKKLTNVNFPFQDNGTTVVKRVPCGSQPENNMIIIPELEEAAQNYIPKWRVWTEREKAIVWKYYGKVPIQKLSEYLNRSKASIQNFVSGSGGI